MNVAEQTHAEQKVESSAGHLFDIRLGLACFTSFTVALIACLLQNFSKAALESAWVFDSGHYLLSCQQLIDSIRILQHNLNSTALITACGALKENLLSDGPILPSLGALVCVVFNKSSVVQDARLLIVLQGFLHAISAALVCLLAKRMTGKNLPALAAGFIWALYPPAIVAAGKFLSETLATVLLLAIVVLLDRLHDTRFSAIKKSTICFAIAAGMLTGCIMLTKPALSLTILLIDFIAVSKMAKSLQRLIVITLLLIGITTTLLPWAAYSKITTGQVSLTNQRMPTFNVVSGLDPETDGWGSLLETPFVSMFSHNDDTLPTAWGIFQSYPKQTINLTARKLTRLWSDPWNDFRLKFFGLPVALQKWWHQILLFFGVIGFLSFLSLADSRKRFGSDSDNASICLSSALIIAGHLAYLLVVTNVRYGFTAMPFFILFACLSIATIGDCSHGKRAFFSLATIGVALIAFLPLDLIPIIATAISTIRFAGIAEAAIKDTALLIALTSIYVIFKQSQSKHNLSAMANSAFLATALAATMILAAYATTDANIIEWPLKVNSDMSANRKISLNIPLNKTPDWAMVLIDGNNISQDAQIYVNGKSIQQMFSPLCIYTGNRNDLGALQIYSSLLNISTESFRQWRIVPIPLSDLNFNGTNIISIKASPQKEITIYGSYPSDSSTAMKIPSLFQSSATKLLGSVDNLDFRLIDQKTVPISQSTSWLTKGNKQDWQDLSPAPGKQFGQYRLFIIAGYKTGKQIELQEDVTRVHNQNFQIKKQLTGSPMMIGARPTKFIIDLPASVRSLSELRISLEGQLTSKAAGAVLSSIVLHGSKDKDAYFIPGTPTQINTIPPAWNNFQLSGDFPCASLPLGKSTLVLSFSSNTAGSQVRDLRITIGSIAGPEFRNHVIQIY